MGTCAGMIVLDREHLGLVDVEVERNAYGRQVSSFEADLKLAGDDEPLRGVFIRAPRVRDAGTTSRSSPSTRAGRSSSATAASWWRRSTPN